MGNPFKGILDKIAKAYAGKSANMLITTGIASWVLSSAGQIYGILKNPKIDKKEKKFLLPQEVMDAVVNIISFGCITLMAKKVTGKLYKTGKWATPNIRKFLNEHKSEFDKTIGTAEFDIEQAFKKYNENELHGEYKKVEGHATLLATILGSILASNIVTPIGRNYVASKMQKKDKHLDKITDNNTILKPYAMPAYMTNQSNSAGMKI